MYIQFNIVVMRTFQVFFCFGVFVEMIETHKITIETKGVLKCWWGPDANLERIFSAATPESSVSGLSTYFQGHSDIITRKF